eukprot:6575489-Alexandrium_andersonii.AAC.1
MPALAGRPRRSVLSGAEGQGPSPASRGCRLHQGGFRVSLLRPGVQQVAPLWFGVSGGPWAPPCVRDMLPRCMRTSASPRCLSQRGSAFWLGGRLSCNRRARRLVLTKARPGPGKGRQARVRRRASG